MKRHIFRLAWTTAAIVVICALSTTGAAQKKGGGGGGGGPDGTTIFYHGLFSSSVFKMNSDGSAKTEMFSNPSGGTLECSYELHNGQPWFMQKVDPGWETYEYAPVLRFFSGTGEYREFPLDFGTVDPEYMGQFRWVPGDQEISFVDRRIVDGEVVEVGIFAVQVEYLDGAPTGISTPYLKVSTPTRIEEYLGVVPVVTGYDWSPDRLSIVYGTYEEVLFAAVRKLYILDSEGVRLIRNAGHSPKWAPGTVNRIVYIEEYSGGSAICTIGADGSGWKSVLAVSTTQQNQKWLEKPEWSPTGASIAYTLWTYSNSKGFGVNLYKVAASGSGNTKLGPVYRTIAWK